jgi:hypothetical protein
MIGTEVQKKPRGYEPDIVAILISPEASEYHLARFLGEIKTPWAHGLRKAMDSIAFAGQFRHLIG